MNKPKKDVVSMLLSNDSPSHDDKCKLANEINTAFLQSQQVYTPLSQANRLDTTTKLPKYLMKQSQNNSNQFLYLRHMVKIISQIGY